MPKVHRSKVHKARARALFVFQCFKSVEGKLLIKQPQNRVLTVAGASLDLWNQDFVNADDGQKVHKAPARAFDYFEGFRSQKGK